MIKQEGKFWRSILSNIITETYMYHHTCNWLGFLLSNTYSGHNIEITPIINTPGLSAILRRTCPSSITVSYNKIILKINQKLFSKNLVL